VKPNFQGGVLGETGLAAHKLSGEDQVARRGDGEKLRQSLEYRKKKKEEEGGRHS